MFGMALVLGVGGCPVGVESGAKTSSRGVKMIFTKGEIIPMEIPLVSANPTMRAAVARSLPR
jgi:hypothetical protein